MGNISGAWFAIDFCHATGAYQKYGPTHAATDFFSMYKNFSPLCFPSIEHPQNTLNEHEIRPRSVKSLEQKDVHLSHKAKSLSIHSDPRFFPPPLPGPSSARHWYASKHAIARSLKRSESPLPSHFHLR